MLKYNNHIGLDLGSKFIKLVQVAPGEKNKFKLLTFGQAEVPESSDQIEMVAVKAEIIKKLVRDTKVTSHQAVISLPESQVYTRVIEMPILQEPELTQAIHWQAEQYIPVPLTDVVLKHQVLNKDDLNMNVLLVAAPSLLLNNHISLLSSAGLETVAIETEILAVARVLVGTDINSPTTMLVHSGAETTTLSILSRGNLVLTQAIPTGGSAITRAISSTLGLDVVQAEEYKRSYGLEETKLEGKVASAIKPVVELLLAEFKRVLAFYNVHGSKDPVKRVVLSGGTALLPGFVSYLTTNLDVEVQVGDPFLEIITSDQQKQGIGDVSPAYSTAVGLSIKPT